MRKVVHGLLEQDIDTLVAGLEALGFTFKCRAAGIDPEPCAVLRDLFVLFNGPEPPEVVTTAFDAAADTASDADISLEEDRCR